MSSKFPFDNSEPDAVFIQANNPPFPAATDNGHGDFIDDLTAALDECIASNVAGSDRLSGNASQSSDLRGRPGENPDSYVFVSKDEQSAGLIDTLELYLQTLPNEYATDDVRRNAADNARRGNSNRGTSNPSKWFGRNRETPNGESEINASPAKLGAIMTDLGYRLAMLSQKFIEQARSMEPEEWDRMRQGRYYDRNKNEYRYANTRYNAINSDNRITTKFHIPAICRVINKVFDTTTQIRHTSPQGLIEIIAQNSMSNWDNYAWPKTILMEIEGEHLADLIPPERLAQLMDELNQAEQAQDPYQSDQIDEFDYLDAEQANFGLEVFHAPNGTQQLPNMYFYLYGHSGQGNGVVQRHVEIFQNDPLYYYASLQLLKKLALFKNPSTPEKIGQLAKGSKIARSIRSIMQRRS